MAKSTDTQLAVLDVEMKAITEKLDTHIENHRKDFKSMGEKNDALGDKIDDLSEKLDKKYAGKWVEKFNIGVMITAVGAIIIAVIAYVTRGGK